MSLESIQKAKLTSFVKLPLARNLKQEVYYTNSQTKTKQNT